MNNPLVSVIVTTRNNEQTIEACLSSVKAQTYKPLEIIVVDNFSTDKTMELSRPFADVLFQQGPERSEQRNMGAKKASGEFILIADSDMQLSPEVVAASVAAMQAKMAQGVIIPEESFGEGFWAQCKRLERSYYIGLDAIEAARFFRRETFLEVGGYDTAMVSGEDWDLSARIRKKGAIARVQPLIYHNEGRLSLSRTLQKKYYYAGLARTYLQKNKVESKLTDASGPLQRYKLFFSQPKKLWHNPLVGFGMLFMKTCEFGFGALGYVMAGIKK